MASNQNISRHIAIAEDTSKICKAMEMIATVKMRRAQDQAIVGRPYVEKISQVISDLAAQRQFQSKRFPLLAKREVKKITVVHISTDRGLCGDLNDRLNRLLVDFLLKQTVPVNLITIGRKSKSFISRIKQDVRAEFTGISNNHSLLDINPITRMVIDDYSQAKTDLIYLAYNNLINTSIQQPVIEKLLPIELPEVQSGYVTEEYIWEPDAAAVLEQLLPRYIEIWLYHAILELVASEHSARMLAMRNASDNATEMIQNLTLNMNRTRQETITNELCDITRLA